VLHLLYARFFTKVLRDLDLIALDEPFRALLSQGMVIKDGAKMSKSKGNVVDPDDMIRRFGADATRLFTLFAAPPERDLEWTESGVEGASRFLNRLWRFVHAHREEIGAAGPPGPGPLSEAGRAFRRVIHETVARVTSDVERDFHFNTAISAVMELVNALHDFERDSLDRVARAERAALLREAVDTALLLLGPVCPHIGEELWTILGRPGSLFTQPWPTADPAALRREAVEIVVQVDGRVRTRLTVEVGAPEQSIREAALAEDKVRPWIDGRQVAKVVVATLCVGGCGYSLQGNLPDHIKSVAVPVFRNRTTEPGVESTISSAVVNAFTTNGKLRVVSLDAADSMLEGEIIGFEVQSLAFDSRLNLRSYRLAVTMNVRFRDLKKSAMLWEQQGLREVVDFQVAGQVADTVSREEGAVKQAAVEIGRKVVNHAVDRF